MKKQKFLSLILSFVLIFTIIFGGEFSATAQTKTGKCGENASYSYNTSTSTLTIKGSGEMTYFMDSNKEGSEDGSSCPWENWKIKKIVVKKGITSISSFNDLTTLTSVTLPSTLKVINSSCFAGCTALESISIPNSVTTIEGGAFYETGLTSITIPKKVKTVEPFAFAECKSLKKIILQLGVEKIGDYAFNNCKNLADIYYTGTENDFKKVEFSGIKNVKIHYDYCIKNKNHSYYVTKKLVKANRKENGKATQKKCKHCGQVIGGKTISKINSVKLDYSEFKYNGKSKKPNVIVKNANGKKIDKKYYTVSYPKDCKSVGKHSIKITFNGIYSGSCTRTFYIVK